MNWFYSIITAFCAAGVCFGALFVICPDGKTANSVKYLVSLCFLAVLLTLSGINIKNADFSFDFEKNITTETENLELNTFKYAIETALRNSNIDFKEISLSADNLEDGGIRINKVTVFTDCSKTEVVAALGGENKDFKVEVINE